MTQKQRIINHLNNNVNGITSLEAIDKYGITRLSGIIHTLRREGHDIISKLIPVTNRYGDICYVSRYTLGGENEKEI